MFNWGLAILLFLVLIWLSGQQTVDYLKGNVEKFVAEIKIEEVGDASANFTGNPVGAPTGTSNRPEDQVQNNLLRGEPLSEISRAAVDDLPEDYWNPFQAYVGVPSS